MYSHLSKVFGNVKKSLYNQPKPYFCKKIIMKSLLSTEISWLPHSQSIKDCLYLIKFVLRCLYIEDDNRFMFLTEIKNVGKPDVEIDVKY